MAQTAAGQVRFQRERGRGHRVARHARGRSVKDLAVGTWRSMKRDYVPLLAAGVAFFAMLALVPSLVALVSTYGLVADPAEIERSVDETLAAAPDEVRNLVTSQLGSIVESEPTGLRLGAVVGLVVALWSASAGVKHLVEAVHRAYGGPDTRGFVKLRVLSLALTLGAILLLVVTIALVVVVPQALDGDGTEGALRSVVLIARWPVFAALALVALAVLYRFAPDRQPPRWHWLSPGAVLATIVWVVASIGFSIYTDNFGTYNETYGALGAIVVVMLWLYISAYAIIAGAELNAEVEKEPEPAAEPAAATPTG